MRANGISAHWLRWRWSPPRRLRRHPAPAERRPTQRGERRIIVVPPGHLSKTPPKVYSGSRRPHRARRRAPSPPSTRRSTPLFKNDPRLVAKIKKAAAAYGIDPIHIIGAIVGEHTYNIDTYRHAADLLRQGAAIRRQHLADLRLPRRRRRSSSSRCRNSPNARRSRTTTSCGTAGRPSGTPHSRARWSTASSTRRPAAPGLLPADVCRPDLRPRPAEPGGGAHGHRRRPRQERPAAARASTMRRRSTSRS